MQAPVKSRYKTVTLSEKQRQLLDTIAQQHNLKSSRFARYALTWVINELANNRLTILNLLKFNSFSDTASDTDQPANGLSVTYYPEQL